MFTLPHRLEGGAKRPAWGTSLLALFVSGYSTYWQRQQTRAMTWPRVSVSTSNYDPQNKGQIFKSFFNNTGVGPADIRSVQVTIDGKPFANWRDVLHSLAAQPTPPGSHVDSFTSTIRHRVIPANAQVDNLTVLAEDLAKRMNAARDRIRIDFCYCSLLGECWRSDSKTDDVVETPSCVSVPDTFRD